MVKNLGSDYDSPKYISMIYKYCADRSSRIAIGCFLFLNIVLSNCLPPGRILKKNLNLLIIHGSTIDHRQHVILIIVKRL